METLTDKQIISRTRNQFYSAVKKGKIKRIDICTACGSSKQVQAHHNDYTKPFEVVWLCCKCHRLVHQQGH